MGYILFSNGKEHGLKQLLKGYSIILSILAIYGVFEFIFGNIFDAYTVRVYAATYRLHSLFLHPIIFSLMLLQSLIINHYLIKNVVVKGILTLINIFCIFMSLSRSSWLVLGIILIMMMIHQKYIQKKPLLVSKYITKVRFLGIAVLLCVIVIIIQKLDIVSYLGTLMTRWQALEGSMSVQYRLSVIASVFSDRINDTNILHWLIGSGYHSVQASVANAEMGFATLGNYVVDNQWISIFFDFGFIGLAALVYLTIKSLRCFFGNYDSGLWIVSLCMIANLLMALICDTFGWAPAGNVVFVLSGILFSISKKDLNDEVIV